METEEDFSDDSLEAPKRKHHKKNVKKNVRTYSQIYQRRLTAEILKIPVNLLKQDEKQNFEPSGFVPLRTEESIEKKSERPQIRGKCSLWSEFLSSKYKMKHTKSEVNEKIELLRKRLDYGKKTNQINKVNQMCLQLKMKQEAKTADKTTKDNDISFDELKKTTSNVPKATIEHQSVQAPLESLIKLQDKLEGLKSRHQNDMKIVDQIRESLSSLSIDLK